MEAKQTYFKGKKNIYLCGKCGKGFVSQDLDDGVTPFTTGCLDPLCRGYAHSMMYAAPQEILARINPAIEWYKPTHPELDTLTPAVQQHVLQGGLISRKARATKPEATSI